METNQEMSRQSGRRPERPGQRREINQENGRENQSPHLEEFVGYLKTNWKVLVTELVTAGVAAYRNHGKKQQQNERRSSRGSSRPN